ncbi:MAG: prepilin-type N-terminal cleavage/methylation domain-containing protein [bacterium]|nr:prepilin-type N-terminal cleavage/methylation domain-containing protein [bacterium]
MKKLTITTGDLLGIFRDSKSDIRRLSKRGFSLVEMIFYVIILSFALVAVMQTLIVVTRSYGVLRSEQRIEQEAAFSLERITREIRDASGIDDAGSIFGTHPGKLLLNSTDALGVARTVEFSVDTGKISLKENGVVTGLLTSGKATVTNLVFRKITTTRSKGVKVEMTLSAGTGVAARTENFFTTALLRDSY